MSVEVAVRFAKALDAEDYQTAESMLSEECEYLCRGQKYCSPNAIIETYRGNGASAKNEFDSIEYESDVTSIRDGVALIHFIDHLSIHERHLTFECQQLVHVGEDGRIVRIEQIGLPGQRKALAAFRQGSVDAESKCE
ncbi:MAG: hypothetical protein ACFCD0_18130 [Gemmataceae bacterium]